MRSPRFFLGRVALAVGLIVAAGCSSSSDTTNSSNNATDGSTAERTAQPPTPPERLTEEECLAYCDWVLETLDRGNNAECFDLIAYDKMLDRSIKGIELSEKSKREYRQGSLLEFRKSGGMFGMVSRLANQGKVSYSLVCLRMERRPIALFRMISVANGAVNYHQVTIVKCPDGKIRAEDLTPATTGESFSQTSRRLAIQIAVGENQSFIDRLSGKEKAYAKHLRAITAMGQAYQIDGDPKRVMQIYKGLPEELQQDKTFLILYLLAATAAGSMDEYLEGFETLKKHYPSDPSISLMGIDYYSYRGEYDKALESLDDLQDFAGDDAYLYVLRGGIHLQAGDLDAAHQVLQTAIELESDLSEAYFMRLEVWIAQKDFEATLSELKTIDQKFLPELNDFESIPEYAEFVASPQYQAWLEYRRQPSEPSEPEN